MPKFSFADEGCDVIFKENNPSNVMHMKWKGEVCYRMPARDNCLLSNACMR